MWGLSGDGYICWANEGFAVMAGQTAEETVRQSECIFFHQQDQQLFAGLQGREGMQIWLDELPGMRREPTGEEWNLHFKPHEFEDLLEADTPVRWARRGRESVQSEECMLFWLTPRGV